MYFFRTLLLFLGGITLSCAAILGQGIKPLIIKTQLAAPVSLLLSPIASDLGPRTYFLEIEKGLGEHTSVLLYGGIQQSNREDDFIVGVGSPYIKTEVIKLGLGYRYYLKEGLEGVYFQPLFQYWQGEYERFSGDTFENSSRKGGSLLFHAGYQWGIWKGLVLDGSLGLGVGREEYEGNINHQFVGMHYLSDQRGGTGLAGDIRLGLGWKFD